MPRSGHRHGHTHEGLDIVTKPVQTILSPIAGEIVREALPYGKLSPYTGIAIRGDGEWQGYEVKVFYVAGNRNGNLKPGDTVGTAQDLTFRYPNLTNHVHIEVRRNGNLLSPNELFATCF
jgi:hypothetical protein